jgi:tetratricopeptide (TPR) repeat protein
VTIVSIQSLIELINTGRAADAEQQVTGLLRARPSEGILWKILSVAQVRQNKDAMAALRRTAELLPDDAEAHANLGSELAARRQWDAALQSLRRSLAINPSNPDVLVDAADAQLGLGRYPQAVEIYQQALKIEPRRAEAHNNLGNALLGLGDAASAASSYKTALALRPQDAQILCNLGNALRQTGELEHAEKCTRLALGIAPDLGMAHNNLGLLLAARGERDAAIASYRAALRYNPGYIEALSNLGNVLRECGLRRESLAVYQQAVELDPKRADSHRNLGQALLESRRTRQAVDSFRQAVQLQPRHAGAHLGLATALRVQRRPSEAEASCRLALEIAPTSAEGLVLLGELNADRGRFAEAHELFERALTLDPSFAPAYSSIASHRRMTPEDGDWLRGVQSLLSTALPMPQEMQLRYALGKYLDDTGSYAEAFASYQQANEINKRLGGSYDPARLTSLVDGIIHRPDYLNVTSDDSQQPVFIVGMPRSGTSLAEQILSSHASVFGAGEVAFWDKADPRNAQLAQDYLKRVREHPADALRITDKMPANFLYLGLIHAVFPRARIIHMRRHPLDTCLSVYFQSFFNVSPYANDLSHLAHYYGQYLRIMEHWRRVLPADTLLEVQYEELVQDTESWARRMVDFVGLPWDPSCLEFHRTERAVITASKWQVRQKINTGSVGRWRKYARYLAPLQPLAPQEPLN